MHEIVMYLLLSFITIVSFQAVVRVLIHRREFGCLRPSLDAELFMSRTQCKLGKSFV